ncbi:MAG: NAD kinase [Cyclobacteriaceae bacterium]|nr:NAD kinase [Cyclobacteriaceae bacterium]
MRIGVHGKDFTRQSAPFIEQILERLTREKVDIVVSSRFQKNLRLAQFRKFKFQTYEPGDSLRKMDLFFSLGGDGTLLESVTHVGKTGIPIFGINTGRLGFLATVGREEIDEAMDLIFKKEYDIDERVLLSLHSDRDLFGGSAYALNDFTLVRKDSSSMITVHTFIDGEFLNSYWADGIIVATPTGSTGYSLSCGGPLVFPGTECFIVTPVSPHNLTVRPIVVPDASEITFRVEGRSKKFIVSLDSRMETVDETVKLMVKKANIRINLVQLRGQHYFKTLRQKLNWGLEARN